MEATSEPVVIVTLRGPREALAAIVMFRIASVASVTDVEFTVIPAPLKLPTEVDPKWVYRPVTATLRVAP
jgi:hypothetical protein